MSQVTTQIDAATLKGLDDIAAADKTTREAVARRLLESAVAADRRKSQPATSAATAAKGKGDSK